MKSLKFEPMTPRNENKIYLFVYGTLKRGQRNNFFLETAEFICETTTTSARFSMVNIASKQVIGALYPTILEDGNFKISGEIYAIDLPTLERIDVLEEIGVRYKRMTEEFISGHRAFMYLNIDPHVLAVEEHKHIVKDPAKRVISWG
jgi:gamma-glutamylcyclotransferase (GGCT)/AIG2-like uncharacterized protein YtfP